MSAFSFDDLQRNPKERRDAIHADLEWAAKHSDFVRGYRAGIEAAVKEVRLETGLVGTDLERRIRALPDLTQDAPEGGETTANAKGRQEESGA